MIEYNEEALWPKQCHFDSIPNGDNGTNRQITSTRHGHAIKGGKGTSTVNGTHVPLIVRAPGIVPPGTVSAGLFDFTDVLPTLADLADASLPDKPLDGVSQLPVLTGRKATVRDSIFIHYAPRWMLDPARFVFDANWKLYGDGRFVAIDFRQRRRNATGCRATEGRGCRALRQLLQDPGGNEGRSARYRKISDVRRPGFTRTR